MVGTAGFAVPFYYSSASGIIDLNTLINPALGYRLVHATGINDSGEVVGYLRYANGVQHGFKLKVPPLTNCALFVVDDGNPCTVDSCSPVRGVTHLASTNGSDCQYRSGRIEAESFDFENGMISHLTTVSPAAAGASLEFGGVDFGAPGTVGRFQVVLGGAQRDQHVELRLDSAFGLLIADLRTLATEQIAPTPQSVEFVVPVSGIHRVVLVARSSSVGSFDWFSLEKGLGRDTVASFSPSFRHENPGQGLDLTNPPPVGSGGEPDVPHLTANVSVPGAIELAPGESQFMQMTLTETIIVLGRATWSSLTGNISIAVLSLDGQLIAAGTQVLIPGASQANVRTDALTPQRVRVQITNNGVGTTAVTFMTSVVQLEP